jgi:1-acyl-sn-glycerol-3-phosphate acyltransferase
MLRPHQRALEWFFKTNFRQTVQSGLRGVWVRGEIPSQACVLAGNHHSWWDSYLMPVLYWRVGAIIAIIVTDKRMAEFSFFPLLGAVAVSKPREALTALKRNEPLIIFPEGELRAPGGLGELNKGTVWFAQKANVPLVAVASRVVNRGQEFPEAYLEFSAPISPDLETLRHTLDEMLKRLDTQIRSEPAEQPLSGFRLEIPGRKSTHERMAFWSEMLTRLTGRG